MNWLVRLKELQYNSVVASSFEFLKHPAKLISSLFEAPPHIVVDANKATESVPVVLSQVTAPEGMCGWIPSEVGTPDWVCQAFLSESAKAAAEAYRIDISGGRKCRLHQLGRCSVDRGFPDWRELSEPNRNSSHE